MMPEKLTAPLPDGYIVCCSCRKLVSDETNKCPYCGSEQTVPGEPTYYNGFIILCFAAAALLMFVVPFVLSLELLLVSLGSALVGFFALIAACAMLFVNIQGRK